MQFRRLKTRFSQFSHLIIVAFFITSGSLVLDGKAQPTSTYYYRFTVDREGFTNVEINFSSRDVSGESWVFVPKNLSSWNYSRTSGQIVRSEVVETDQVAPPPRQYFYQAFKFRYQANGFFNMTLKFGFNNGALIIEPRGMFYSPQIGFEPHSSGIAEVLFDHAFKVKSDLAKVIGGANRTYSPTEIQLNRVLFGLPENIVRIQVEFSTEPATPQFTPLRGSDNKTFIFKSLTRYRTYAQSLLRFYDRIYNNLTRLFNVTLDSVTVQWFLPDFQSLLTVGGYVPVFTGEQLGEININIVYIRTVNGMVEVIAAHELTHHFLGKAGLSPNDFLWFHEGMAQYTSVNSALSLGYEGAKNDKDNLENGVAQLIQNGEDLSSLRLQYWTPRYQPAYMDDLYVASYYVASRLPEVVKRQGFDYYGRFFKLIGQLPSDLNGVKIKNISELALYLSKAVNASVASTLRRWGFNVADLYDSPVRDMMEEAGKAVVEVNPVFQPSKFLAEYFYQQALSSAEQGDWERAKSFLQLTISLANLAPLLTFLTIVAMLALLVLVLSRRGKRVEPIVPLPPPPPPEIFQAAG